ncbi:hypothetical protein KJ596_00810 [Patescibacteria group bacterium]|nr:hypothetical protein [Patescibacteria group bacterium]MBU1868703.1 hypothetical protein [Patescibacteria group bacterium]
MSKYKIVGIINFIFGSLQIIYSLLTIFIIIPKLLTELYTEVNVEMPSFAPTYLALGFNLLLGIICIFLGYKLFSKHGEVQKKYYKFGLALAIVSVLFGGVFSGTAILSAVLPIYNLTLPF